MKAHTIFAWTGPTPLDGYPGFVNISRDEHGNHTMTVRAPGDGGRQIACTTIPVEALESLLGDLAADLYRDDAPGVPAVVPTEPQWGPILDALDGLPNDLRDEFAELDRLIRAEHERTLARIDATRGVKGPSDVR